MAMEAGGREVVVPVTPSGTMLVPAASRISWGAIFGGAVAALAIWLLLYSFGLAVGLSTIDPTDRGSLRASGLFTGLWGAIAPLAALFVGGVVAGRAAGVLERKTASIHGLVMWGVTLLLGTWMVASLLGSVMGAVGSAGRTAVQAGGGALAGLAGQAEGASQALGLDADDALAPVNQRLRAEGKPPVQASQLEAATRDVVQDGVRQGRMDRNLLVQSIAQNTALSRGDAEEVATRIETQVNQARARMGEMARQAETGALKAADATGKAFWGVFGALLLGLVASILGSLVGVRRRAREWADTSAAVVQSPPVLRERPGHA
jgi:hypothetical protein